MSSISTQNSSSASSTSTTTTTISATPPAPPAPAPPPPVSILLKSTPPLSLSIPSTSSPESSKTSSPTAASNSTASCSSLYTPHQNLNVKFAPLPELEPRKRKSSVPLGVASRGQLVRRRRGGVYDDPPLPQPVYVWSEEEGQHVLEKVRSIPASPAGGEEFADPFVALGRMMKGAGKTLWRRMSNKELSVKNEEDALEAGANGSRRRVNSTSAVGDKPPVPVVVVGITDSRVQEEGRVEMLSESGGEGKVWEEEIGQTFMGKVSTDVSGGKAQERVEEAEKVPKPPPTATTASAKS